MPRTNSGISDEATTAECLLQAVGRWKGDHIALLRSAPHGAEIIDIATEALKSIEDSPVAAFEQQVVRFLMKRKACAHKKRAQDVAHTLDMASKGLMVTAESPEAFAAGMKRIINALLD